MSVPPSVPLFVTRKLNFWELGYPGTWQFPYRYTSTLPECIFCLNSVITWEFGKTSNPYSHFVFIGKSTDFLAARKSELRSSYYADRHYISGTLAIMLANLLACQLVCLPTCLLACLLANLHACQLACLPTCLLANLLARLLAHLLSCPLARLPTCLPACLLAHLLACQLGCKPTVS